MSDELYQERILQAARAACRAGRLDQADASAYLDNPLCGDRVTVDIRIRRGRLDELGHEVRGCLLCEAAASMIGAHGIGEDAQALRAVCGAVVAMLGEGTPPPPGRWHCVAAFGPVRAHPSRHECVLLPFRALVQALDKVAVRARG